MYDTPNEKYNKPSFPQRLEANTENTFGRVTAMT